MITFGWNGRSQSPECATKLLLRTTRRVTPTDAGAVFLERTRRVLGDLDEAAHAARGVDSLHG
ncbi:MAG TPA: hypothetical protein VJ251_23595, partial [Stellaceae bacterium]|nr:hypothetical protein [Stellaceae bacterium]